MQAWRDGAVAGNQDMQMLKASFVVISTVLALAGPALADGSEAEFHTTTAIFSARGEVKARPDLAVISVGVQAEGPTAADALNRNRIQMNAALAALRASGVAAVDVQTSSLDLQPQYVFDNGRPRRLTGYQADNVVTARLRNLQGVGATVDALVAAGANQINSISFEIADRGPLENAARREAVKALRAKAELYATASGYRVSRLVSLTEGEAAAPPHPLFATRMAVQGASPPSPVEPGELSVSETVTGEYELAR